MCELSSGTFRCSNEVLFAYWVNLSFSSTACQEHPEKKCLSPYGEDYLINPLFLISLKTLRLRKPLLIPLWWKRFALAGHLKKLLLIFLLMTGTVFWVWNWGHRNSTVDCLLRGIDLYATAYYIAGSVWPI